MRAHFDIPVTVLARRGSGRLRRICDIKEAACVLLELWPADRRDASYTAAKRDCLDVLEGRCDGTAARKAFMAAALDGEISCGRRKSCADRSQRTA